MNKQRLIVGISGASGVIYGIRLLQVLRDMPEIETHLVMTKAAKLTAEYEVDMSAKEIEALADVVHNNTNVGASISSGTFKTMGMAVIPCSIKSLSGIANAFHENLLIRAADVVLKERRRLVVVPRETPLTRTHLELMIRLIDSGGIMVPPMPAFYTRPKTVDDIVNHTVGKVLDLFGIEHDQFERWSGKPINP
ncbi:MAG: UbiX family flavin prenyltransferase [SAR324 cluster bacterium]|nr:UbiX family flavin prenyltransferase [SAR324 cluster bacterium]MCH8886740.1 UbiX family flavin prenyltransferase [SAR324 cluster bacterium]